MSNPRRRRSRGRLRRMHERDRLLRDWLRSRRADRRTARILEKGR